MASKLTLLLPVLLTSVAWGAATKNVTCDIAIAGGSLAAVATALTAARRYTSLRVCMTDITDWPGGQATASGTSAIDFGANDADWPANIPKSFADWLQSGPFLNGTANPGACTVSIKCFPPEWAVAYFASEFAALSNLEVFLSTAVIATARDPTSGVISGLTAVQRTPAPGTRGYERLLSEALSDWYSPQDSAAFSKTLLNIAVPPGGVVVEATEFGDVLLTSGVRVSSGIESPLENSTTYDEACGQATTIVYWQSWQDEPAPRPDPTPEGNDAGFPMLHYKNISELNHALTWRRSIATNLSDHYTPYPGDLFMINEDNDLDLPPPIFLPLSVARASVLAGEWAGGINLTALALAEARAFNSYWGLINDTARLLPAAAPFLYLNATAAGTSTGLAKMPYLRESRRSQFGIGGFRLCHQPLAGPSDAGCWQPPPGTPPGPAGGDALATESGEAPAAGVGADGTTFGYRWRDIIGIGQYNFDAHKMNCSFPPYMDNYYVPAAHYYMPFRALTSWDAPNLLVAGKGMAQTFYANAATRLHPEEWVAGVAAGAAAGIMVEQRWGAARLYYNVSVLQAALVEEGSPLEWTPKPLLAAEPATV